MDVRVLFFLCLGLVSCTDSVENGVLEDEKTHIEGGKFYEQRCSVCHGPDGKLGVSEAKDLSISTLSNNKIEEVIKDGKGAMPPFGHSIESDSTLIELIEYVKSLRE